MKNPSLGRSKEPSDWLSATIKSPLSLRRKVDLAFQVFVQEIDCDLGVHVYFSASRRLILMKF